MDRVASGTVFSLAAAVLFGVSLPASRALFDLGSNPLTVGVLRYLGLAVCLALWVRWRRHRHPPLVARQSLYAVAVGIGFALVTLGQLLALARIPVSLTTLVFYTYPAMTVVAVTMLERRAPGGRAVVALGASFAGLWLALDVELHDLDVPGVAFALLAAASASASFLLIERKLADADSLRSSAMSAWGACAVTGLALALFGDLVIPSSVPGRTLLLAVMLAFAGAVVATFIAVGRAGSVRTALVLFLEPVVAIAVAVIALGERLSTRQLLGAALVIAAVIVSTRLARR